MAITAAANLHAQQEPDSSLLSSNCYSCEISYTAVEKLITRQSAGSAEVAL